MLKCTLNTKRETVFSNLAFPRTQDTFILDTDASDCGIGAVLSQNQDGQERVVAYGSRTLTKAEQNYCTTCKEMLAVVYFIKHFRSYLLGHPFVLRTDHVTLKWLSQFKEPKGQVARWLKQLQEYEFTTEHRPSKTHGNADALSCHPENSAVPVSSCIETARTTSPSSGVWTPVWSPGELKQKQEADPSIGVILSWKNKCDECPAVTKLAGSSQEIRSLWAQWNRLELFQGVLCRHWEDLHTGVITRQLIIP